MKLRDEHERAVVAYWRRGHLSWDTVRVYLYWVRRFRSYCRQHRLRDVDQLSLAGVRRFLRAYVGPRTDGPVAPRSRSSAENALHAWASGLRSLGVPVPSWPTATVPRVLPTLLQEYCRYRKAHNGVSESTLVRDAKVAEALLAYLRRRSRPLDQLALADIDRFLTKAATRVSTVGISNLCSSLRSFVRFLHATGRLPVDLASGVMSPRFRASARPPRTLPWQHVQRILRAIRRSDPPGKRDYAMLLLLATYGLGAAEVLGLRLEDIDWQGGVLRARRPKTQVNMELPLLPAVARALSSYLRWERPPAKGIAKIFLSRGMPYAPITSGAIRHRIRLYASLAKVSAKVIGAHAFRHSHASRQIDAGANLNVVSSILGHRSTASTSVYVRVALKRLRGVGLRVPR